MTELDAREARKREDEARLATAAAAWRKRSRRVKLYRRVLPILILVLAGVSVDSFTLPFLHHVDLGDPGLDTSVVVATVVGGRR